jgi:hypothetical protein
VRSRNAGAAECSECTLSGRDPVVTLSCGAGDTGSINLDRLGYGES